MFIASVLTIIASFLCVTSDILSKSFQGTTTDLICLRFLLSFIISLIYYKSYSFISIKNLTRGIILSSSLIFFTYGLKNLNLSLVILINFATPIWTILLSKIFLKENISNKLISALINTLGIFIAIYSKLNFENTSTIISLLIASFLFATTEIINKTGVNTNEKIPDILIGTSFFAFIFLLPGYSYTIPNTNNIITILKISLCSLVIPYCTLLASKLTNLSTLQPLKYIEFPIAILADYLLFQTIISKETYYAFFIIFIGTIFNYIYELNWKNQN